MGKVISDEDIKLNVIINGNDAQKKLNDLEKDTRKLNEANKDLLREKAKLEKQGKQETDRYKELSKTIRDNNKEIRANKDSMSLLQKEIGITGLTMKQLTDRANVLRMSMKNAIPNGSDHQKYKAELAQITGRLDELNGKGKAAKITIGSLADRFNRYAAMGASVIAVLTGIVVSFQGVIDINGKLADAQSDVMKTTGMTKKEVDELTRSFGLLETRTSRIDLLKIAEQGGRIGILKDDIGDFVDVMNKASVALGDSFTGGAEEVAEKLGKIKFLFEETKNMGVAQAYNSIGSAINDLGANGVASEANIAEFTTRIGSLTDVLKPSIQETLALGTAFEESGIEAEVSARAYNIFMKQASTESAKFAKVMGISQKAVEAMINENPLKFMMKFAEGMRGMDATKTAKTLEYLGVNADGANKVIGAMGNNMARFHELIDLSNNSFSAGTSLINEYNIKNKNLAATIEKLKKKVIGWFSSDGLVAFLTSSVNWLAKFVGATEDADGSVAKWRTGIVVTAKILAVLIASLFSYSAATRVAALLNNGLAGSTILFNIALRAQTVGIAFARLGLIIYTGGMNLFGFSTDKASASLARLNLVSKASPWGALLALITAVVVAYVAFSAASQKAVTTQETFARQQKKLAEDVAKSTADTRANLSSLISLIQDENVSMGTRKKAYEELIKLSPAFNGMLVDEKFNIEGLLAVYKEYLIALDMVTRARALSKLNESNIKKQIQAEQALFDAERKLQEMRKLTKKTDNQSDRNANDIYIGDAKNKVDEAKANLENAKALVSATNDFKINEIKKLEIEITLIEALQKKLSDKYGDDIAKKTSAYRTYSMRLDADRKALEALVGKTSTAPTTSPYHVPDKDEGKKGKKDPNSTQEEIDKLRYESVQKYLNLMSGLERKYQDEKIEAMVDGYEKELAIEDMRYQRQIEDLEKQKIHDDEFVKLEADRAKAKVDGDMMMYNHLTQQKVVWTERNKELDKKVDDLEISALALHKLKLSVVEEKAANEKLKKDKEQYDLEKVERETKYNEELVALGNNEFEKRRLKKKFDQENFDAEEKYLKDLLGKLTTITKKGDLGKIDLSLLTPEQVKEFEAEAKRVGLSLKELIAQRNQLANKEGAQELGLGDAGETDIMGFSLNNWMAFYDHLEQGKFGINEMTFAVGALSQMWEKYNGYLEQNENASLQRFENRSEARKRTLDKQLKAGIMSQEQHDKVVEVLDRQVAKKKYEIEYKQAKRKKAMSIVETVTNTAVAIMQAYAQLGPIGGTIAAVLMGTIGALEIASIAKQPLPAKGYEKGLYPQYVRREQDGKMFKAKYNGKTKSGMVTEPTLFLAGEGHKPEMVIDSKAWAQMNPKLQQMLIDELRSVKGFEKGFYKDGVLNSGPTSPGSNFTSPSSDALLERALDVMEECTLVLQDLRDNGVEGKFYDNDHKSMDRIRKGIKAVQERYDKNKL